MINRMQNPKLFATIGFVIVLAAGGWFAFAHPSVSASPPSSSDPKSIEYTDDVFHFRLSYPAEHIVREYAEDEPGARTVAFEGPSLGESFQVFVVPYAESSITPERFKKDDPSGVMKD